MAAIEIDDTEFARLKGKVIVVTGGSSGIGLATVKLLLDLGALVVNGDLNPSSLEHPKLQYHKTNVSKWADLIALFKQAKTVNGRIDHAFANAGIGGRDPYLEEKLDANGELLEPNHKVIDVNLKAVINTSHLAFHYMRHQSPAGGSVVLTASASSFQRFLVTDYTTAKHGVLGFMRGIVPNIQAAGLPVRVNTIAPGWTETKMVSKEMIDGAGLLTQSPEVVARSVAMLMVDESRQGQMIYSDQGKYWEIEENKLLKVAEEIQGPQVNIEQDYEKISAFLVALQTRA